MQLPAPAKQLARLYSSLASDRRRNCTRLHRGCNDALLLGSRPSPALPNRSHYLGLRLRHWIAPNIHYLNLPIILGRLGRASAQEEARQGNPSPPALSLTNGEMKPTKIAPHLQVIARSHVCVQTSPRPKLCLSRYSCFALVLYLPKFPERIHGLSAVVGSSSWRSADQATAMHCGHTTRPTFPFPLWLRAWRH